MQVAKQAYRWVQVDLGSMLVTEDEEQEALKLEQSSHDSTARSQPSDGRSCPFQFYQET